MLTTKLDLLSGGVRLVMILHSRSICYALNERTINLLMKGKIDMNAVTGELDAPKFSDAEISGLLEQETDILITVVKQLRKRQTTSWGSIL